MKTRKVATNVDQYLRALPAERRRELEAVRAVVRANLPSGYIESIDYGMIGYAIPLARFPRTYNGKALCYAGLAAQKNHNALYLMGCYMDPAQDRALRDAAAREGKKLDMGKSCLRFRRADELPLRAIGAAVASTPVARLIELHDAAHGDKRARKSAAASRPNATPRAGAATRSRVATRTAAPATTRGKSAARKSVAAKRPATRLKSKSSGATRSASASARAAAAARTRGRRFR
ncbi:MAG TPA: DUF1801 domain-containing protein [Candidatus Saccharimonadia bacterium]|nr:DUF1801 domain-containing protein [Candidatus Saccharimonadia bacterium]